MAQHHFHRLEALQRSLTGRRMGRFQYLKLCVEAIGLTPKRIAEVGVLYGKGAAKFRELFPAATLFLVDSWCSYEDYPNKQLFKSASNEKSELRLRQAYYTVLRRFATDKQVQVIRDYSVNAAQKLDGPFDLIFIDANHSFEFVSKDIRAWRPKMAAGGLLCGHDFKRFAGVRKAVNKLLPGVVASGRNKGDVWVYPVVAPSCTSPART